jgi:hypothetical protein
VGRIRNLCGEETGAPVELRVTPLYRALATDATTAWGLSPVSVVHDELGQVRGPTSSLYDAAETATGAQVDPPGEMRGMLMATSAAAQDLSKRSDKGSTDLDAVEVRIRNLENSRYWVLGWAAGFAGAISIIVALPPHVLRATSQGSLQGY